MRSKREIVKYWIGTGKIKDLRLDDPSCFACHCQISKWSSERLQICHLIPDHAGGLADYPNVVLMCATCHREAPMIGISAQPMIDWINSRNCFLSRRIVRVMEELQCIDPGKLADFLNSMPDYESLEDLIDKKLRDMKFYPHPGGDSISSVVAAMKMLCD